MGKGSNIRPRDIPKEQYDANFERIFSKAVKKPDSESNRNQSENGKPKPKS